MTAAIFLDSISQSLLTTCSAALSKDRTGNDPPLRQNVTWGTPPNDAGKTCGQLTVGLDPSNAIKHDWLRAPNRQDNLIVAWGQFVITLFRCVPTMNDKGTPPSPDDLTQSAAGLSRDMWALMQGLYVAMHSHSLYTGQIAANDVNIGLVHPLTPSGGYAGFEVRLAILLADQGPT